MNAHAYYSRPDVQKELVRIAKDREIQVWFGAIRGRRPEVLNFTGDLKDLIRQGVTSFHISEERWSDPLQLKPGMNKKDLDELRIGWDLILDLDGKDFELSRIAGELILEVFKLHNVKDYTVKFSVTGDTPILIRSKNQHKLKPIAEVILEYKEGAKFEVLSLDKQNKICYSKITDTLEHKDEVYKIYHEQSGLPLKVTAHHSVFCWSKGLIHQKKVSDLKEGDFLISFIDSKNLDFESSNIENSFTYNKQIKNSRIKITKELMRLIGYYLSEGHTAKENYMVGFSFNKNELDYISDCKKLIESLPGKKLNPSDHYPNEGSHQVIFYSKEWFTFFRDFCGTKDKKHVPDFVWSIQKEYFLEMLIGYIRGDAHKRSQYYLTIKSVAHQLTWAIVWLCKMHGISCNIYEEFNKPHLLPQGTEFRGCHTHMIKIPRSEIGLSEFSTKRNKFSPYPGSRLFPTDGLNLVYYLLKPGKFLKHRNEWSVPRKKRANINRIIDTITWFENYHTQPIDHVSQMIIDNYKLISKGDICVVPIRKIVRTYKTEKVYDISVEGTERFFGNFYPVLLHNSGNKGLHIGVPFETFPEEVNGVKIKDYFPEGVRVIAAYINSVIEEVLVERILQWKSLSQLAKEYFDGDQTKIIKNGKFNPFSVIDIDSVLISSRHLVRAPYSFNEKSGLVSVIIKDIKTFKKDDAKPENVVVKSDFLRTDNLTPGSSKELLVEAFDWFSRNKKIVVKQTEEKEKKEYEAPKVKVEDKFFPPCVKLLMKGLPEDGRKRGVFIMINFLRHAGWDWNTVETYLLEWNARNYEPLRENEIKGQISWFKKQKNLPLPPNCNNEAYYKGIGVCQPDGLCAHIKNPVSYMSRKLFLEENKDNKKSKKKS